MEAQESRKDEGTQEAVEEGEPRKARGALPEVAGKEPRAFEGIQQKVDGNAQDRGGNQRIMSDTPRTDAKMMLRWVDAANRKELIEADFARELERENAMLREELKQAEAEHDRAKLSAQNADEQHDIVVSENEKLRTTLRAIRPGKH